jgi:hypothetical protein
MGTWGAAVFSDDTACEVRDDWRDHVGNGLTGSEATDRILDQYRNELDDPDTGPVIWLSLAITQWKNGRLEDRVRNRAMEIIDDGTDLRRWADDARLRTKRANVLAKVRAQLVSPQPPARKIRTPFTHGCEWDVGEVVAYRLRSGRFILFRVVEHHTDKGGTSPVCEFYDWSGEHIPSPDAIERLRLKPGAASIGFLSIREYPVDRLVRLNQKVSVNNAPAGVGCWLWRMADERIEQNWGYQ